MPVPTLTRDGEVSVLVLGDDENRFTPDWMLAVAALLDEVVADAPTALVLTAQGKFFSNGLDLAWLQGNPTEYQPYISDAQHLLARVLELPVPTVAAVQGHCFAAGAMLSLAADRRVMRSDRGFWCLPEIDINLPFTPGMASLIQAKLTPPTANEAMTTGRRYGGEDARAAGIVEQAVSDDRVLAEATDWARAQAGKNSDVLGQIKRQMYGPVLAALRGTHGEG